MKNNQKSTNTTNNNNNINNNNLNYLNNKNSNNNNNNSTATDGHKLSKSASSPNNNINNNNNGFNVKKGLKSKSKSHRLVGRSSSNNNSSGGGGGFGKKMGGGVKDARRGLEPLEFEECIVDSPEFRDNLNRHEKELDHTSHQIKKIIKEVKDLMSAAKVLSTRMKQLAYSLKDFNFECIGTAQTDDELVICESLKHFGDIISMIEDEREKMLTLADEHIIEPLEDFRKKQIGGVKENKKKFDKKTEKFCQSQERFLNMSTKKPENTIQEADASLGMHEREYVQESLSYVLRIQEVQERIKFEFVEILLAFISSWLVFYHTAHEQAEDNKDYLQDLRHKVQKTRENFEGTREKVTELKLKYMEKRTATWTKYYCTYKKQKKEFTMLQFNQMNHSFTRPEQREEEKLTLVSCQRRASEFEKRFCFDLTFKEKPGITYLAPGKVKAGEEYQLDETGFAFVRKCIETLENRGLEDEGIYRKSGVGTKISKLLALGMDRKKAESVFNEEQYRDLMESNTIASALKTYLRNLNEPLMTYRYHKQENLNQRVHEVHKLVYKLPQSNFEMLDMVIRHLTEVSRKFEKNKMSVFNLGVVFGPTLLRPQEETVAAILDIKFNNINDPSAVGAHIQSNSSSPPVRVPRASQANKSLSAGGGGGSVGRNSMYSPQQVYRVVTKSNFTDSPMSSSLQNIPNGMIYGTSGGGGSGGGGSGGNSGVITSNGTNGGLLAAHATNGGSGPKSLGMSVNMGSVKNLHSMSQSDISMRRNNANEAVYGILTANTNGGLTAHHATPANATNLRHDYLMATATPASTSIYSTNTSGNRISLNNVSPPTLAMRKEALYGTGSGPQQHPPVQLQRSNHLPYASNKHYPSGAAASTSSSNESVCDSLSSTNGGGGGGGGGSGRLLSARGSIDYVPHSSQATSLSTLLGSQVDDVVTATAAPSMIVGSTGSSPNEYGTTPQKVHRNKDVTQIKRDLEAGTARVRTLYACLGESEGELSFEPNQIITNARITNYL
ncbi:Rho GTPase-activating protein 26 [Lucilia cuprina]|nr:Rho GTPase-activating protein 26 [Lucilia cuprina]